MNTLWLLFVALARPAELRREADHERLVRQARPERVKHSRWPLFHPVAPQPTPCPPC
ncbi:hypothetical protein Dcar01_01048 [Deinococcus carri]|uniref:Uncharacterized protein n=1 Tax=Deinococcus carri TaxID=1211323 RepID=A0ABP9W4P7_9DEIO